MLSHLALTDIYHGIELNLKSEWGIVRATFILMIGLIISVGMLAARTFRSDSP